jgi:hypothetical protein
VKDLHDFWAIVDRLDYPGYHFTIRNEAHAGYSLQIRCDEGTCNVTGKPLSWTGRKWKLSSYMTDGEVVQTAFMAVMAANEHETREKFTYRGVSVFDPHYDIEKLVELRRQPDALKERTAAWTTSVSRTTRAAR